ncbi:unnamed protein product [Adineta ricciae]|uniref:Uncharacterized protein n=1 Tax=Adineta ricciae TaxID=249248 RepID=A0A816A7Z9_ADIRI|nr:unnamed protein product [Adineta ricciae]CAF1593927.1 unnamed protein product [Adineta ricciae]
MFHEESDESTKLIDNKTDDDENISLSRLEWAESSYIRWPYLLFWWWINPILSIGYKRKLLLDDLDNLPFNDKSSILLKRLEAYDWTKLSIWNIISKEFGKEYFIAGLLHIPSLFLQLSLPLIIRLFVLNLNPFSNKIYIYSILLLLCSLLNGICYRQADFYSFRVGIRIRNAFMSFIYRNSLSMKLITRQKIQIGYMINLMANDTQKLEDAFAFAHKIWEGFVISILVFLILSYIMNPIAILIGYSVILLIILIQLIIGYILGKYRHITCLYSDKRVNLFNEMISGCDIIKMNNWEELIKEQIKQIRDKEMNSIRKSSYFRALSINQFFISSSLLSCITFSSCYLLNYSLNSIDIFIALAYFSLIRDTFMHYFSFTLEKLLEAKFAANRISTFIKLILEQNQTTHVVLTTMNNNEQKGEIEIKNGNFSWNLNKIHLLSINLRISSGSLIGIYGEVGSGKSSLLCAILGEMNIIDGEINTNQSTFSYLSQTPSIFLDTIRNNIIFNEIYDQKRYHEIIHACCLEQDFHSFGSTGDLTFLGEKGINLSGGQKVRIALARVLYRKADIYLIDDPLSAVDYTVAKQIYDRCFGRNGLLKNKTCLLVTHQIEYLENANQIIYMSNGSIKDFNESSFTKTLNVKDKKSFLSDMLDEKINTIDNQPIICEEISYNQNSKWSLWYRLFTAPPCGLFGLILLIVLFISNEIFFDGTNYWLSQNVKNSNNEKNNSENFLLIYVLLTLFLIIINYLSMNYFYYIFLNGSNYLHNQMVNSLLYTSMLFFESNPIGRNLNRISKDQQVLDESLPRSLLFGLLTLSTLIGSFIMISITNSYVIVLFFILIPIFIYLCYFYWKTNRQLKELESLTRSPIYSQYTSSLNNLITIRIFNKEEYFLKLFHERLDNNIRTHLNIEGAGQWSYLRLEFLASLIMFGTSLFLIFFSQQIPSSMIAFILVYSMTIAYRPQRSIRRLTEADLFQISAERIDEYGHLPKEEEDSNDNRQLISLPLTWPSNGKIQFYHYSFSYRSNLENILKNIHIEINSGEKIGIIGRTGAGKSSLFKSLFRFINEKNIQGQIFIDNIDISQITLKQLRINLSIIPQHSILFSGTLRYNLDPFNQYSDEQCWNVLNDVQLKEFLLKNSFDLSMNINENGLNLSIGQCQLISIARTILKQTKILLIDEGTANIDYKTDEIIQNVIKEKFSNRTVLIIAHRLNTIINCDRILVLDKGSVVNFDKPNHILQQYQ